MKSMITDKQSHKMGSVSRDEISEYFFNAAQASNLAVKQQLDMLEEAVLNKPGIHTTELFNKYPVYFGTEDAYISRLCKRGYEVRKGRRGELWPMSRDYIHEVNDA